MGNKWVHRLSDLDKEALTAVCAGCGPVQVRKHKRKDKITYECRVNNRSLDVARKRPYRKIIAERLAKGVCERCGFVAESVCQLDVDHITRRTDGGTDSIDNLWVICANCHRLKTSAEGLGLPFNLVRLSDD